MITRSRLRKLEHEGSITRLQKKKFYDGVRKFYISASDYMLRKFPFSCQLLKSAKFVDVSKRDEILPDDVCYFVERYKNVLNFNDDDLNKLEDEIVDYQLLEDIPKGVWENAQVRGKEQDCASSPGVSYRMDGIWTHLTSLKSPDGCSFKLSKVAFLVMTIPHSNAAEERIFNLIRANKTDFRHSLDSEGTLSSIIAIKMSNIDSHYKPPQAMLQNAKKATWNYNKTHSH